MKYHVTSHAVDRFVERVEPGLTFAAARLRLENLMPGARACGRTSAGESAVLLPHEAAPVAVIRHRGERRDPDRPGALVLTVLTAEMWERGRPDEIGDVREAFEALHQAVPPEWRPSRPPDISTAHQKTLAVLDDLAGLPPSERGNLWLRVLSLLEGERRRVEHFEADRLGAADAHATLAAILDSLRHGLVDGARGLAEDFAARQKARQTP